MSRSARFRMAGPGDLFKKLDYNIRLIGSAQTRAAAAWATLDTAVTAWSFPDWCLQAFHARGSRIKLETIQRRMIAAAPGLEACRMIANAFKHFEVTRSTPVQVHNNVVDLRGKSLDPATQQVIRTKEHVAIIHWNGSAETAEQFMATVAIGIHAFLVAEKLEGRGTYLDEIPEMED